MPAAVASLSWLQQRAPSHSLFMTGFKARLRASSFALAAITLFLCAGIATTALVLEHRRLLARSGLSGDYRSGTSWEGAPEFTASDGRISAELVRRRARERNGNSSTVTWRG